MRMGEIEIHDYARQLLDAYGDKAVVTAAQRACRYEKRGQTEDAETWRHIGVEGHAGAERELTTPLTRRTSPLRAKPQELVAQ